MTTPTQVKNFISIGECMLELSPNGELWQMGIAGDTLNTAWYARARLEPADWNVSYFTGLGTDTHSDKIVAFLDKNNIGTADIVRDPARRPGLYIIQLKDGERSFSYWRENAAARHLADDKAILQRAVAEADIVYFSGITLAILPPEQRATFVSVLAKARRAGKTVAFDPNIRPALWETTAALKDWVSRAAAQCTIVLPSFEDECEIFGDADLTACAQRYVELGAQEVVVKNGGGPMVAIAAGKTVLMEDLPRSVPIDSTGAGDSFNGAYLAERMLGKSIEDAIALGHNLAARVVRHPGALMDMELCR